MIGSGKTTSIVSISEYVRKVNEERKAKIAEDKFKVALKEEMGEGLIDIERTWYDTFFTMFITIIGGTLSAGGSNAINMWYDSDIDVHMTRTKNRPIPSGQISPTMALIFGFTFSTWAKKDSSTSKEDTSLCLIFLRIS